MNIVVTSLKKKAQSAKRTGSVRAKRVRNPDGKLVNVLSMDANSDSFIDDLALVFKKNVAKARQENRRLFGSPDPRRSDLAKARALARKAVGSRKTAAKNK
jgi:hypothetical protein